MNSRALPEFWDALRKLPPSAQRIARKNFRLWKQNPSMESLAFKKIKEDLWSVRAGSGYRALATFDDECYLWFWIGPHDEYERLLRDL